MKKEPRIKPQFIKNSKGETVQVFLDMESYESMMRRIKKWEAIKAKMVAKNKTRTSK